MNPEERDALVDTALGYRFADELAETGRVPPLD
jgi:hypothetical protein